MLIQLKLIISESGSEVYFIAIFTPLLRSIACKADILFSKALPE
jgi:hypothetical protein